MLNIQLNNTRKDPGSEGPEKLFGKKRIHEISSDVQIFSVFARQKRLIQICHCFHQASVPKDWLVYCWHSLSACGSLHQPVSCIIFVYHWRRTRLASPSRLKPVFRPRLDGGVTVGTLSSRIHLMRSCLILFIDFSSLLAFNHGLM